MRVTEAPSKYLETPPSQAPPSSLWFNPLTMTFVTAAPLHQRLDSPSSCELNIMKLCLDLPEVALGSLASEAELS